MCAVFRRTEQTPPGMAAQVTEPGDRQDDVAGRADETARHETRIHKPSLWK